MKGGRRARRTGDDNGAGLGLMAQDGAQQLALVAEVTVNQADVDVGVLSDVAERRGGATSGEMLTSGLQDGGSDFIASGRSWPRRRHG
jgi:hypothetical protein